MNLRNKSKWYLAVTALFCLLGVYGINRYHQRTVISEAEENIRSHGFLVSNRGESFILSLLERAFPTVDWPEPFPSQIGILRRDYQSPCNVVDVSKDLKTLAPLIVDFKCGFAEVGNREAAIVGQMHQLTSLSFGGAELTDAGAQSLSNLQKLGWLSIHAPQVTDKGMSWISQCPDLWRIYLIDAKIGEETLQTLSNLPKLRTINLSNSTVHSTDLRHLKKLKVLRWLVLSRTKIDDRSAPHLKHLNAIVSLSLDLNQTLVGDQVCEAVTNIENLKTLRLDKTAITDIGVRAILEGCENLEYLSMLECNITANAFSDL
jgi:Leucine-rich repeat (LRR) protein